MANEAAPAVKSAREHAAGIVERLADNQTVDGDTARRAAVVPNFSKGTFPIDEETGKVIRPPEFVEEQVEVQTPTPPPEPPVPPAEPAAQAAGTQAAEAAAPDPWSEYEEFEVDDPDLGQKYSVRVQKQYAQTAKRAYPRRAQFDRMYQRWGQARPIIEPLLEDGRLQRVVPLIERALSDPAYGEYVYKGYERSVAGRPLIEQAIQEAGRQAPEALPTDDLQDPYLAAFNRFEQSVNQRFQTMEQREELRVEQERRQQADNQRIAGEVRAAHNDLAGRYPGKFHPSDTQADQEFQRVIEYARESGAAQTYGIRAGLILAADAVANMEAERIAATASPAAMQLDEQQTELARRQAAESARMAGGGAPSNGAPQQPQPRPTTKNADGTLKPPGLYIQQLADWHRAQPTA